MRIILITARRQTLPGLDAAQSHAAREVRLECPRDVTGFFSRLGLKEESSSGDAVEMMIPGDLIDLDTCKNCPKASCPNRHG